VEDESVISSILIVAIGMLAMVVVLLVIMHLYKYKVHSEKLEKQEMLIVHKRELLQHSIQTQEKERNRLAAELHDGVVSRLNIIHLKLSGIEKEIPRALSKNLEDINELLHTTIDDTRRMSYDLLPQVLESFGLITALEEICEVHKGTLHLVLKTSLSDEMLDEDLAVQLYRIVQELVNNTLKYSQSTKVVMQLDCIDDVYLFEFRDNGANKKEAIQMDKGIGLKNIYSRLSLFDGDLAIEENDEGLTFKIRLLKSVKA
jgi:signal transduction histidine kinase